MTDRVERRDTITDVCAGIAMMAFLLVAGFWLMVL